MDVPSTSEPPRQPTHTHSLTDSLTKPPLSPTHPKEPPSQTRSHPPLAATEYPPPLPQKSCCDLTLDILCWCCRFPRDPDECCCGCCTRRVPRTRQPDTMDEVASLGSEAVVRQPESLTEPSVKLQTPPTPSAYYSEIKRLEEGNVRIQLPAPSKSVDCLPANRDKMDISKGAQPGPSSAAGHMKLPPSIVASRRPKDAKNES